MEELKAEIAILREAGMKLAADCKEVERDRDDALAELAVLRAEGMKLAADYAVMIVDRDRLLIENGLLRAQLAAERAMREG